MSLLVGALALGAAAVATAVAAEFITRRLLKSYGGYYRYRPYNRERLEIDRTALPALNPVSLVRINRDGERGNEPPRKDERAWRALVVGGSAAECYYLDQDQTWPAVLERRLSEPASLAELGVPRVHIGNIAKAILPCEQITMLLSRVFPRYDELDAIFVMVGASDVIRWMEKKTPAKITEGAFSLSSIFELHPEGPWGWSPKQTALWHVASRFNMRLRRPEAVRKNTGDWLHRVRKMRARAETLLTELPDPTPMLDHFEKYYRQMIQLSKGKAKRVIVVRQPWFEKEFTPEEAALLWNFGMGRPYIEEVKVYAEMKAVHKLLHKVDDRAKAINEELGVEQLDLMPILERSARVYYDTLHFTPAGAKDVADAVLKTVLAGVGKAQAEEPVGV
jgi:lysophospholipase L1-like esterase